MLYVWFVGFANDGEAAVIGQWKGTATFLNEKIDFILTPNYYIIHRFVIHDAVKHITELSKLNISVTFQTVY